MWIELILSLLHQIYAYAEIRDLCDKDYSAHLSIKKPVDDVHGTPFSDADLKKLWDLKEDPTAEMLLIMCYSGYRISAYKNLEVNLEDGYFRGGVKTAAGKNRVVPIHPGIRALTEARLLRDGGLLIVTPSSFRGQMGSFFARHGLTPHRAHDCRHTFSALCERYGVAESDRKRMLGHSFGSDITNAVYSHRTLKDLKSEIEKIPTVTNL